MTFYCKFLDECSSERILKNRSIFGEDMNKSLMSCFFDPLVSILPTQIQYGLLSRRGRKLLSRELCTGAYVRSSCCCRCRIWNYLSQTHNILHILRPRPVLHSSLKDCIYIVYTRCSFRHVFLLALVLFSLFLLFLCVVLRVPF